MDVQPGTRLGPYEVVEAIGAGGMGVVYRARDTKLGRDVALKILPDSFAGDSDRLARFEREARVLASLNHPNVAAVYAVEDHAIAMELVEGRTIADLLKDHEGKPVALPVDEALRIARQIAEGLEAAHELGIIHRDLKPANIKVREDGTVKVLDFGLAKAMDSAVSSANLPGSDPRARSTSSDYIAPTMTSPAMTAMGMILGTAAYIAPEQARGKSVDRRADVWAFGVVLYEMLSGRRLFEQSEISDTLAAVLTRDPDPAALPAQTPQQVRRLLTRCLAKDKRERLDSMSVARLEIEEALRAPAATSTITAAAGVSHRLVALIVAGALLLGAAIATTWFSLTSRPVASSSPVYAQIGAPAGVISAFQDGFALSPDGTTLAFTARDASGAAQLWVRRMDSATAQPIRGTENGRFPFWSPDSAQIGFFADGQLRRVPAAGGLTICTVAGRFPSASWGEPDEILFALQREGRSRLYRVAASGGEPAPLSIEHNVQHPEWLPGGRRFLYAGGETAEWGLRLGSIDSSASTLVTTIAGQSYAYSRDGYVFFNQKDVLTVQRFDHDAGKLIGSPVTIAGKVGTPKTWFALSAAGNQVLALVQESPSESGNPGDPWARLRWVNRRGEFIGDLGESGRYWTLRLDPQGVRAAVNPGSDLWVLDPSHRHVRITSDGVESVYGVWSPDGSEIIYQHLTKGIMRQRVAQGAAATVLPNAIGIAIDWSRDGRWLLLEKNSSTNPSRDLLIYDLQESTVQPWLATEFNDMYGRFSPDGRWIAYASNATNRFEVYIRARTGSAQAIGVSTRGGSHPIWRRDGQELFYLSPDDEVMAASLNAAGDSITVGETTRLFRVPLNDVTRLFVPPYDVAPDGQRFLLNVPDRPSPLFFLRGLSAIVK
jgi:Tol biopolymer transport system component/predicted Ser/Thr protein kinase